MFGEPSVCLNAKAVCHAKAVNVPSAQRPVRMLALSDVQRRIPKQHCRWRRPNLLGKVPIPSVYETLSLKLVC
jgi:hypothetical protein